MQWLLHIAWLCSALIITYVVGVALVVTGGLFMARWFARHDRMDEHQAKAFGAFRPSLPLRIFGQAVEVLAASFDLFLRFLWLLRLLPAPSDPGSGTPIVLLPGYSENAGAMWWFAQRLRRRGFRPVLIDFPSTFVCIDHNVAFLRERLRELRTTTGSERIAIVAHSMGGVVARALLLSEPEHNVLTLIALASPFRGTHMAKVGALFRMGASAVDLCPESPFAVRYLPSARASIPIRSIIGEQENIVSPPWSCVLPDGETYVLSLPVGHDGPLHLKESYERVEAWLEQDGVLRAELSQPLAATSGE
jgi:pimeloyl-ACP methyl ester carboxylesterase